MKLRDSLAENKSIRLQAEAETWQDAVKIGVDLLVAADVVEPRYYQSAILMAWNSLPLFRYRRGWRCRTGGGRGVKKTGFSLVTLKKPLEFNHDDNDPVDILITMAAVDANTTRKWASCRSSTCLKMKRIFDRLRLPYRAGSTDLIDRTNAAA